MEVRNATFGRSPRTSAVHLLAAAVALGLLIMPVGLASGGDPGATVSASLRKQVKSLKQRVAALEGKPAPAIPTSLPPSGPASGDLTGSFPSPQLGVDVVGRPELQTGVVRNDELGLVDASTSSVGVTDTTAHDGVWKNGTVATACDPGEQLLSGGGYWSDSAGVDELAIQEINPDPTLDIVEVTGVNDDGTSRTLVAEAICLVP